MKKATKNLEISLWNRCNNNCIMCTNPSDFRSSTDFDPDSFKKNIAKKLLGSREKSINSVYLTGGEPTIHPDFFGVLDYLEKSFPSARLNILTNGRRLFYRDFVKKCLARKNINFIVPIHADNPELHDKISGAVGSFEQTLSGVKNLLELRKPDQSLEIRIIITKLNYKNLDRILSFLLREAPTVDRMVLIFLEYEGQAIKNRKVIGLKYGEFYGQFEKLDEYLKKFKEFRLYHFPLCVVPSRFWPNIWRTLRDDETTFVGSCRGCLVKCPCLGIHEEYLKLFGSKEFRPIKQKTAVKLSDNYHHPILDVQD